MPAFLTGLPLRIKCESSWKGLGMELSPGNLKKKKKKKSLWPGCTQLLQLPHWDAGISIFFFSF
jgi:hypothetical protein